MFSSVFFLYLGPGAVRWLTGRGRGQPPRPLAACLQGNITAALPLPP